jgi:hypothetical protein
VIVGQRDRDGGRGRVVLGASGGVSGGWIDHGRPTAGMRATY